MTFIEQPHVCEATGRRRHPTRWHARRERRRLAYAVGMKLSRLKIRKCCLCQGFHLESRTLQDQP